MVGRRAVTGTNYFAMARRDEVWSLDRHALVESRLIHGTAVQRGNQIDARDDRDEELVELCDRELDPIRSALSRFSEGRARAVGSAVREDGTVAATATVSITLGDFSVVSSTPQLVSSYGLLVSLTSIRPEAAGDYHSVPVVWRNGSAAVLMHEAAGHPAEHAHAPLRWPDWLTVVDESDNGGADLFAGEAPRAMRRESFSDVPLPRMTSIVVGSRSADIAVPEKRIDILLVAGGRYEPLTETVSLSIAAANLVDGKREVRLRPFVIHEPRSAVARAVRGAAGEVRRYPGVICSREGQELFVGSSAPDLITEF